LKGCVIIMKNRMTDEQIMNLFFEKKISRNEMFLLISVDNKFYLRNFLVGEGGFKLYHDSTVPYDFYFTNIYMVLKTFYDLYEKYPEYKFDDFLFKGLEDLSNNRYRIYEFLSLIFAQIENEQKGISPFYIDNISLLDNCKGNLNKYKEVLANIKDYKGINRENGQLDVIKEYNEGFKTMIQYDIFQDEEFQKKTR